MADQTIAYLTDAHLGQKIILDQETGMMRYTQNTEEHKDKLKFILKDIASNGVTEIIFGGDIGAQKANQWFFKTIDEFNFKFLMVLGNHDSYQQVSQYYKNEHRNEPDDELYYADEEGQFKFIYLDSSSNAVSQNQLNWLLQELDTDKEILLFIHHPVLEIETPLDKVGAALKGRDEIKRILSGVQKDIVVFCGHYHMTDELIAGNIRQYSSPACSYQIEKLSEKIEIDTSSFGYRLITINGRQLSTEVKLFKSL
ncbi:metallophosphoesterase family protein [Pedobacter cryoconitis]|uniref:metallophosphoesterase family protein n=1 Tax=Pedobacter cryoconitis TaxID=188932 RepID=UPI00161979A4|nr:metallophosphoesterase [Pedobacter cryoconitis]MBB5646157.1 Icc-related predicted phosphoesterase [Pedobacter cryoconitis]